VEAMRRDVIASAVTLVGKNLGAVVLECTNLISYKSDIQKVLGVPVFDLVTLITFYVAGLRVRRYESRYI
jgi:Asp/Glu/hydantoin racemase